MVIIDDHRGFAGKFLPAVEDESVSYLACPGIVCEGMLLQA